jgi:hypothetical protein
MSIKITVSYDDPEEAAVILDILKNELPRHRIKQPEPVPGKRKRVYFTPKRHN